MASRKGFEPLTYGLGRRLALLFSYGFLTSCRMCVAGCASFAIIVGHFRPTILQHPAALRVRLAGAKLIASWRARSAQAQLLRI